jgi:hypothetical protein
MILETDIGIDVNGLMYVLFKQGITIPYEETFVIDVKCSDPLLCFYQGQRVYVKDNTLIGKLQLINTQIGRFELKCNITDNMLKIIINEYIQEYSFINEIIETDIENTIIEKEENIRNIETSKLKYINYINQTLHTLNQLKDKIDAYLIYKIKEAYEIIYIEDITVEEYELAQLQIEGWVNPILNKLI